MLSKECIDELANMVKDEFSIDDYLFPLFLERLEVVMSAHSLPAEKSITSADFSNYTVKLDGSTYVYKKEEAAVGCDKCVAVDDDELCKKLIKYCCPDGCHFNFSKKKE